MPFLRVGGLVGTLLRVTLLILSTLVVVALGGRFVEAIADRTATEPLRSGFAGLLAEVLFVPMVVITIVVLAVSIIGIPLLILVPFAMVLAVVPMLVGFTGVAYQVARFDEQPLRNQTKSPCFDAAGRLADCRHHAYRENCRPCGRLRIWHSRRRSIGRGRGSC
jgi:hypothetical protein